MGANELDFTRGEITPCQVRPVEIVAHALDVDSDDAPPRDGDQGEVVGMRQIKFEVRVTAETGP